MRIDAYCVIGREREYDLGPEVLLREMDAAGVDMALIAPVDSCLAVANREGNDLLLEIFGKNPKRFIPACTVNPWYQSGAIEEFSRAVRHGARMLVLHPFIQGFQANDELVFPILEKALTLETPVYIHTGPPGNATPWQIVDLAERFPGLSLIMGHCGATDFWNDVIAAGKAAPDIYLEASLARPFAFAGYLQALGGNRGIMGSFAPLNALGFEWEQMRRVLPEGKWADVYGNNLKKLLEKRGDL
ncbi:MAG: amidohydrolase family protein [Victivallaceae bacterium]|nr:amidohydrolase family protein [Victivallaceae bacterium]